MKSMFWTKVNVAAACAALVLVTGGAGSAQEAATQPSKKNIVHVATDGAGDYKTDGTDDQVEINKALLDIHKKGGGTVHIKKGTYVIGDSIVIYGNTVLEGDGWTSVIKLKDKAGWPKAKPMLWNEKRAFRSKGKNVNITIRNFKMDGNRPKQKVGWGANYYNAIALGKVSKVTLTGLWIGNNDNDAIKIGGAENITVHNNVLHNYGHDGVALYSVSHAVIRNNKFGIQCNAGIRLYGSNHVVIRKNIIRSIGWEHGGAGGHGIQIQYVGGMEMNDILIERNIIYDTAEAGIGMWTETRKLPADPSVLNIKIKNNLIYHTGGWKHAPYYGGIQINNFNVLIENNTIFNCYPHGICFSKISPAVSWTVTATVKNNIIVNNLGYGMTTSGLNATILSSYNDVWGNVSGNYDGKVKTDHDISVDPLLVKAPKQATNLKIPSGLKVDLYLKSAKGRWNGTKWVIDSENSPCIDAGAPKSAYDAEPLPNGKRINIGAYGNTKEASKSTRKERNPTKVSLRKDGVILIDGKPFFPNGIIGGPDKLKEFSEAGFNTVMPGFVMFTWNDDKLSKILDEADKYGMKVVMAFGNYTRNYLGGRDPECRKIRKKIETFKNHPAVLVWWPTDEPAVDNSSPKDLAEEYRIIKEIDPYHPVILNICRMSRFTTYASCYDILCTDPYMPFKLGHRGCARGSFIRLIEYMNEGIDVLKRKDGPLALWDIPKAMGVGVDRRTPTLKEYRTTVYLPVIHGAKGILPYLYAGHWYSMEMNPQFWLEVRSVAQELNFLCPVLVMPDSKKKCLIKGDGIEVLLKEHEGELYLIAGNYEGKEVKARITISGSKLSSLNVLSEDRKVSVRQGSFTDTFESYQTHIYTTRKKLPKLVISKLLKDSRYGDPVPPQEGDLALVSKGATATASYQYDMAKIFADLAINGDRRGGWFLPEEKSPGWIEVKLPEKKKISKVVIYSWKPKYFSDPNKVLSDYQLQYERDGRWVTIEAIKNNKREIITHRIDGSITAQKIRLMINKGVYVSEIEVYGP